MGPRVTVVVPVFETGPYIEPLIESLDAQTLPRDQFEVVFVDDGSTDETPARLERLAVERANVRLLREPHSGWPGRPRNVGIDAAHGDYVLFVDHDDWLGPEALDRMTRFADAHGSDVLVGRQAGHHRTVAKQLFARSWPEATLAEAPLMSSLTPHAMFRKSFLDEHALRFPEGRRRLEDHVFMTRAYFLAQRVSVLADYHCYFHVGRPDGGNAAYQRIDPAGYYANVREVAELVLAHTDPGWIRDESLRRTLRMEALGRLQGAAFLEAEPAYRRALFDEARSVVRDTMAETVDAGLASSERVRAALLRAGHLADLETVARRERHVGLKVRLAGLAWDDAGRLTLTATGYVAHRDDGDRPWRYSLDDDGPFVATPDGLSAPFDRTVADARDEIGTARLDIVARRRADSQEWTLPGTASSTLHEADGRAWLEHRVVARLDPLTGSGGAPLPRGEWDFYGRVTQSGWVREGRLGADRDRGTTEAVPIAVLDGRLVAPYWTAQFDNLSLHVAAGEGRLVRRVQADAGSVAVEGPRRRRTLQLRVPIRVPPGVPVPARLRLARIGSDAVVELPGTLMRTDTAHGTITVPFPRRLPSGRWRVDFALGVENWAADRPTGADVLVRRLRPALVVREPCSRDRSGP